MTGLKYMTDVRSSKGKLYSVPLIDATGPLSVAYDLKKKAL